MSTTQGKVVADASDDDVDGASFADLFIDRSYVPRTACFGGSRPDSVQVAFHALEASSTEHDLTGQIVWPAAEALAHFLVCHRFLVPDSVLEVGSGAGVTGLVAAALAPQPATVVLTDGNEVVMELLRRNAADAGVQAELLPWGTQEVPGFRRRIKRDAFKLVIGADVVFWPAALPLLFQTLTDLLAPGCVFLCSYTSRAVTVDNLLADVAHRAGFVIQRLDTRDALKVFGLDTDRYSQVQLLWITRAGPAGCPVPSSIATLAS